MMRWLSWPAAAWGGLTIKVGADAGAATAGLPGMPSIE